MHEEVLINEEELLTAIRDQVGAQTSVTRDAAWEVYTRGERIGFRVLNTSAVPHQGFAVEADVKAVAGTQEAVVVDTVAQRFVAALQQGFPQREAEDEYPSSFVSMP